MRYAAKPNIIVRIEDDKRELVERLAKAMNVTVSDVVRKAIEEFISKREHILKMPEGSAEEKFMAVLDDYMCKLEVDPSVAIQEDDKDPIVVSEVYRRRPGPAFYYEFSVELMTDGEKELIKEKRVYNYPTTDEETCYYRVSNWNWIIFFERSRADEEMQETGIPNHDAIRILLKPEFAKKVRETVEKMVKERLGQ